MHRCLANKTECGKPAADAFCKLEGYDNALSFQVMKDVSRMATARTVDTGAVLMAPEAHPFQLVKCWRPSQAPSSVMFRTPTLRGVEVPTICDIGKDCRKTAADDWCIGRGFSLGATGYELAPTRARLPDAFPAPPFRSDKLRFLTSVLRSGLGDFACVV